MTSSTATTWLTTRWLGRTSSASNRRSGSALPIGVFARCKADPFDEDAKREYEALLRAKFPENTNVRYLQLDRQLAESVGEPGRFSAILKSLDEHVRYKLPSEHRHDVVETISRRHTLWLDLFAWTSTTSWPIWARHWTRYEPRKPRS